MMDQMNKNYFISNDEFNDLKLVDQYIPLEECYVENLYPFNTGLDIANHPQYSEQENVYSNNIETKAFYELKKNDPTDFKYYNSHNNNIDYSKSQYGFVSSSNYYDVNKEAVPHSRDYEISTLNSYIPEVEPSGLLESNEKINVHEGEKPPEPYANIIVKAILSSSDNVMQLKDIYNFMVKNYEYFSSQKQSTKWKNSVRHNLSRHKYFVKTCEKNAQGHYWSIDQVYLNIFKNGNFDEKAIKKAKLSSKFKNKIAKLNKKKKAQEKQVIANSFALGSSYLHSSEMSSPSMSCKSFNTNNDSAYLSSTDYANSSYNFPHNSNADSGYDRPNLNLHDALSEIFMDSNQNFSKVRKQN